MIDATPRKMKVGIDTSTCDSWKFVVVTFCAGPICLGQLRCRRAGSTFPPVVSALCLYPTIQRREDGKQLQIIFTKLYLILIPFTNYEKKNVEGGGSIHSVLNLEPSYIKLIKKHRSPLGTMVWIRSPNKCQKVFFCTPSPKSSLISWIYNPISPPILNSTDYWVVWFLLKWFGFGLGSDAFGLFGIRFDLICFNLVWFDLIWFDLFCFALVWFNLVWFGQSGLRPEKRKF